MAGCSGRQADLEEQLKAKKCLTSQHLSCFVLPTLRFEPAQFFLILFGNLLIC